MIKGFVLGVLMCAVIGGFGTHLWSRYGTLNACTALDRGLTAAASRALTTSIRRDGPALPLPERFDALVIQPLTEPLVHERVRAYVDERGWFGCAWGIVRLDLIDREGMVAELRSLTVRF